MQFASPRFTSEDAQAKAFHGGRIKASSSPIHLAQKVMLCPASATPFEAYAQLIQFRDLCAGRRFDGYLKVLYSGGTEIYIGYGELCDDVIVPGFVPSESPFIKNLIRPVGKLYVL